MDLETIENEITSKQQHFGSANIIDRIKAIFSTSGSAGRNNEKLAQILIAYDFAIRVLDWQNDDIASLSSILTEYQASVDAKYHNDFKDVLIAEEIERRRSERKGISILSQ